MQFAFLLDLFGVPHTCASLRERVLGFLANRRVLLGDLKFSNGFAMLR